MKSIFVLLVVFVAAVLSRSYPPGWKYEDPFNRPQTEPSPRTKRDRDNFHNYQTPYDADDNRGVHPETNSYNMADYNRQTADRLQADNVYNFGYNSPNNYNNNQPASFDYNSQRLATDSSFGRRPDPQRLKYGGTYIGDGYDRNPYINNNYNNNNNDNYNNRGSTDRGGYTPGVSPGIGDYNQGRDDKRRNMGDYDPGNRRYLASYTP